MTLLEKLFLLGVASALCCLAGGASAQSFVYPACRANVAAVPRFDDENHQLWYARFWDGDCRSLMFCAAGSPDWNEAMQVIEQRATGPERARTIAGACRVGRLVGFEWGRDNSIRKIDSSELARFYGILSQGGDISAAVASVEQQARADLAR